MTTVDTPTTRDSAPEALATEFVSWLETGVRPEDMFAGDVFADLSLPHWRLQAEGAEATFRLREESHPFPGEVRVEALARTTRGFLLQFSERWSAEGQRWYCRELIHCSVAGGRISELSIYCTGDWDEAVQARHAEQVHLVRP
ncbi:conserved hypothetical protein [Nostocoides japonicum T1-X7]|uniref:SnoaL-like domain-containing protein n=1 Tax=Nostocoides japonicum T1-X7 TaxID=1194083 RepID=A0A077LWI4_9MICO|nr:hypothetical protein [Tetrasphaera japonica]CCH78293.1 conserved hypothetical protein [Tetrasphaera japonica T1-X7]